MIDKKIRSQIKGYLEGFIQGMIDEARSNNFDPKKLRPLRSSSKKGELKPFHESLLPDGLLRVAEFERSFSTKLGTTFEECARLLATLIHKKAERTYRVQGAVAPQAIERIEQIISEINNGGMKSKFPSYVREIINLSKGSSRIARSNIADLYIETKTGEEWFFEMKSPKPNKGQCLEATQRFLQIHAICHEKFPGVKTFYAMAYNPYGLRKEEYKHSLSRSYLDLENEVLIGKEFWDIVAGDGTYEEVLAIYQEVGKEKGPNMLDQLALGY